MSVPVLGIGNGRFIVGPFLASFEDGRVEAFGWPDWIRKVFPVKEVSHREYPWRPVWYLSRASGGIWVVHGSNGWTDMRVLFIDGDGGLQDVISLPVQDVEETTLCPVLASGSWTVVFSHLLRKRKVIGSVDHLWSLIGYEKPFCLGEDGSLLFYDGIAAYPDGSTRQVFRERHLVDQIAEGVGMRRDFHLWKFGVLAWEGNVLWVYADLAKRIIDRSIATVSIFRSRNGDDYVLERIVFRETCYFFEVTPLADGGWFARVLRDEADGSGEKWAFRLPGSDDVRTVWIPSDVMSVRDVPQVAFHRQYGLAAILDVWSRERKFETLLGWVDGEGLRTIRLFGAEYQKFSAGVGDGWISVHGEDGERGVFLFSPLITGGMPENTVTLHDLISMISDHVGRDVKTWLKYTLLTGDAIILQFTIPEPEPGFLFTSFRMVGGRPVLIRKLRVPVRPGTLLMTWRQDGLNALFSAMGAEYTTGARVLLQAFPDGEMYAQIIA